MLLLQGVFRSGTTALFRTLRRDNRLDCFYEPLHPDLPKHAREADSERPDHPKSSLYEEYRSLLDRLDTHLGAESPPWPPYLGTDDEAPALAAYLHGLTDATNRPLLQFNRAFWMIPWLAQAFPGSAFVHLVRDPRSVVWSQLTTASGTRVRMDWPLVGRLLPFTSGTLRRAFSEHAYFGAYQLDEYFEDGLQLLDAERTDPVTRKTLRRLAAVPEAPPYVKALALWGAQVEACHRHARSAFGDRALLLRYEDFCGAPCESLRSIYALQDRTMSDPVRDYARASIDATRLRRWKEVETAEQRFREGIRRAQIADLMRELGYDPS
ncbi:MAG: sulfotransferase [Salinibacter sp.]